MANDAALSEGEVHSRNLRSIKDWIEKNRLNITAKHGSIFYAGRDLEDAIDEKDFSSKDLDAFKKTNIYSRLRDDVYRQERDIPVGFQSLEDVLKGIRSHPKIIDKDKLDQQYSTAYECFNELYKKPGLIAKTELKAVDERLSVIFAQNVKGDLKILDGVGEWWGKLEPSRIFLKKEMAELLRNDNLSPEGKKTLMKVLTKYRSLFDHRFTKLIDELQKSKKELGRGKKGLERS